MNNPEKFYHLCSIDEKMSWTEINFSTLCQRPLIQISIAVLVSYKQLDNITFRNSMPAYISHERYGKKKTAETTTHPQIKSIENIKNSQIFERIHS